MAETTLYDDDILLCSEQQAAALRALAGRRDLPNELDLANVVEEIETVGRSELGAAASFLRLILVHLCKLVLEPEAAARQHWIDEVARFHGDFRDRFTKSMAVRIDMDQIWGKALNQLRLSRSVRADQASPLDLDAFLAEVFPLRRALDRVREALVPAEETESPYEH